MRPATVLEEQEVPWVQALYRANEVERHQYGRETCRVVAEEESATYMDYPESTLHTCINDK